ncbi:hypothetical protein, partial [Sulfobacillus sp. hq2]|uniref:hypothetical protein n=1 Tax=Sulfobacillus sp. hq2 TaxID=2039167 RepID=UPI000D46786F
PEQTNPVRTAGPVRGREKPKEIIVGFFNQATGGVFLGALIDNLMMPSEPRSQTCLGLSYALYARARGRVAAGPLRIGRRLV